MACADPIVVAHEDGRANADVAPVATIDGDPLLTRARRSIANGELDAEPKAALLASTSPVHARARALIGALDQGVTAAAPIDPPASEPSPARVEPLPLAPSQRAPAAPAVSTPRARPTLERLVLGTTKGGGALTIHANSGVLVGVANQPEAGVVRLVLEDVSAAAKVLASRPSIEGARVKDVSAGPKSVRITLQLDPGWRFGGVKRTKSGARVELIGP